MKLIDIHILGFGKFSNVTINFSDTVNVIYGSNEAGKSTIHAFIKAMFFGMERGRGLAAKTDDYTKYEPWEATSAYGGFLRLEYGGTIYRIERNFGKSPTDVTVVNENIGKIVSNTGDFFRAILAGLSGTAYDNTVSIRQLRSATDASMINELKNYIANMNTSGNMSLDVGKAAAYLKTQKKNLSKQIDPEASKAYARNAADIKQLERDIETMQRPTPVEPEPPAPEPLPQLPDIVPEDIVAEDSPAVIELLSKREAIETKSSAYRTLLEAHGLYSRDTLEAQKDRIKDICTILKSDAGTKPRRSSSSSIGFLVAPFIIAAICLAVGIYNFLTGEDSIFVTRLYVQSPLIIYIPLGIGFIMFLLVVILGIKSVLASSPKTTSGTSISKEQRHQYLVELQGIAKSLLTADHQPLKDASGKASYKAVVSALNEQLKDYYNIFASIENSDDAMGIIDAQIADLRKTAHEEAVATARTNLEQQRAAVPVTPAAPVTPALPDDYETDHKIEQLAHLKLEQESLSRILSENRRLQFEIDAIDLAEETLQRLSSSIKESFGVYLNVYASAMIAGMTDGKYQSMSVDDDLNIYLNTQHRLIPISQVSSGTIDQMYLALRLAAANLMQGGQCVIPLMLDDSFVNYDEDRLRNTLRWIVQSIGQQMILFTCHRREAQILSSLMLPYNFIELG